MDIAKQWEKVEPGCGLVEKVQAQIRRITFGDALALDPQEINEWLEKLVLGPPSMQSQYEIAKRWEECFPDSRLAEKFKQKVLTELEAGSEKNN